MASRGAADAADLALAQSSSGQEVISQLSAERAPLATWLRMGIAFYHVGKTEEFKELLTEAAKIGSEARYADSRTERIAILNSMAAYYTSLASANRDKAQRETTFNTATGYLNAADNLNLHDPLTWLGKGVILFYKGEHAKAKEMFQNVLHVDSGNTPALLGRAAILYTHDKNYGEARDAYRQALTSNPDCPPAVRLGLGLCFNRLGDLVKAKQCFERVLDMEPTNVDAEIGLAILDLNSDAPGSVQRGMQRLRKAYQQAPQNPMVLNHLANHFFYRKDFTKVQSLANSAYHATDSPSIQSEACYHMARTFHVQGNFEAAFQHYLQAVRLWESFTLARFGLGQMYMFKKDYGRAIDMFESVLKAFPDSAETMKVLGTLYGMTKRKEEGMKLLRRALEFQPDDTDCQLELARLAERTEHEDAARAYSRVVHRYNKLGQAVPGELWNNLGVLRLQSGAVGAAEDAFNRALSALGAPDDKFAPQNVTVTFNLARVYESSNRFREAEELYRGILSRHRYVHCFLRLGCIARARGSLQEAQLQFKEVFSLDPNDVDAWTVLANLQLERSETGPAQKSFEHIADRLSPNDAYSLIALGNIYYLSARPDDEKEEKFLNKALEFYRKVLASDRHNLYAANGVGIVLADKGHVNDAKDIFVQVREATSEMPDVWINLAHCYLAQGQYVNAIRMYENCLRKFYFNKDVTIMLFLARTYYSAGKFDDAKRTLQKALHLAPGDLVLRYNLAVTLRDRALSLLRLDRRTYKESESAIMDLTHAHQQFEFLAQYENTKVGPPSRKFAQFCEEKLRQTQSFLQQARENEQMADLMQQEIQDAIRAEQLHKEEAAAEKRRQQEERERQKAERLAHAKAHMEELQRAQAERGEAKANSAKRKRKQASGSESEASPEPEPAPASKAVSKAKSKSPSKSRSKSRSKSKSGSDSDGPPKKRAKKAHANKPQRSPSPPAREEPAGDANGVSDAETGQVRGRRRATTRISDDDDDAPATRTVSKKRVGDDDDDEDGPALTMADDAEEAHSPRRDEPAEELAEPMDTQQPIADDEAAANEFLNPDGMQE